MMIDFHTHILPGVDDGSRSIEESLAMLQAEGDAGIERVVFTPHFYASQNSPKDFLLRRKESWSALLPHMYRGLPKVSFGAEVQYFEGICQSAEIAALRIAGTPYLLLEMPFRRWEDRMLDDILELNTHPDTIVVLAHIDRYLSNVTSRSLAYLRDNGVKIQMNVSTFGKRRTRNMAMSMLKAGEVHILGTDCHSMGHRRPNWDLLPMEAERLLERSTEYYGIYDTIQNITF